MAKPACVIVGYGPGTGHGIASAFGRTGFALGLLTRSPDKVAEPLSALREAGHHALLFAADAANADSLRSGLDAARAQLGDPEVMVYNAAVFRLATPTAITADQLVADFRTNVAGALTAANHVLPALRARRGGAILFTGGGWALHPSASVASTAIGKAGLRHLVLMLAEELQGSGVRVGTVTILGQVATGTAFDPQRIGEAFVAMYRRPVEQFQSEVLFRGE